MCRCFKLIMLGVMAISVDISFGYETGDYTYTYEVQCYTSSTNTIVRGISPLKGDMVMPDVIAGYKVTSVDVSFKKTNVQADYMILLTDEEFEDLRRTNKITPLASPRRRRSVQQQERKKKERGK